jgi:hypothetical protein
MTEPTPEDVERARAFFTSDLGRQWSDANRLLAIEFARIRAEEREACALICDEVARSSRESSNQYDHDDFRCRYASVRSHAAYMLAEKIRDRSTAGSATPGARGPTPPSRDGVSP